MQINTNNDTLPYLDGIRSLRISEIKKIITDTPRPLAKHVQFIYQSDMPQITELGLGKGAIIYEPGHVSALWRGMDGDYFYFDSCPHRTKPESVFKFLKGKTFYRNKKRMQTKNVGTCAYHVLAFLDFTTRCRHSLQTSRIMLVYRINSPFRYIDESVVWSIEQLLTEFDHNIKIRLPVGCRPKDGWDSLAQLPWGVTSSIRHLGLTPESESISLQSERSLMGSIFDTCFQQLKQEGVKFVCGEVSGWFA